MYTQLLYIRCSLRFGLVCSLWLPWTFWLGREFHFTLVMVFRDVSRVPASVVRCVGCSYLVNGIAHRRHKRFQQSDLKFLYVTPLNIAYNISALMDAKCNLLSYGRHHSICYTVYLRLYYSLLQSFRLRWVPTLWCLDSEGSFDLFFRMLTADWLTIINWPLAVEI
jgi:hypothetical protein